MSHVIRQAQLGDLPGIADVCSATGQPAEGTGADPRYAAHLLANGRLVVAVVANQVVGFAGSLHRESIDHLTDLFVLPSYQGQGIGGLLLDSAWSDADGRTTFSSGDPRALPLYVRAAMLPRWPLVYVVGTVANLPVPRPGMQVVSASVEQAGNVELTLGGGQRHSEYGFWAVRPHGRLVTVLLDGDPVAVGATGGAGANQGVSHLRVAAPELTTDAALCLIQGLTGEVGMAVPGPNPLLTTLLAHGWRVVDVDYAMASAPALIDPLVVLPHPGLC